MNILSAENVSKSYSEKTLLHNINLGIQEGDKIGVIGVNGTGKSTLLKVLAGVETVDEGNIIIGNLFKIEYLPQNPYFDPEATVMEQVFKGTSPVMKVIREYEEALQNSSISGERMMKLTQNMDSMNAWNIESEAKVILTQLGISDFSLKVGTLSGGQRKRIALAGALINPSDLLILDEPTNHLDNETIDWLEQYLNKRKGALLMITHDRYFLDRVVNRIIEVNKGNLYSYKGNYSYFLEKKVEREEIEVTNEKKRQNLFKKELAWIRKGAKARTTKQKARIDRFEKLSEASVHIANEKMDISVAGSRLGKKIIELDNINKSFGHKRVIKDFSYILLRNDRVGIIGPNGSGKSTLMNIISGKIQPDSGVLEVGETVKIGLYSQETYHMNENLRVIEYIREGGEFLDTADGEKISASQMLEKFLFVPSEQWTPISKLSGGERRRLYLLRVLMEGPNVLLLDEPTNDLDIETLTILEDYLDNFGGPVISVSHDRYFLDRLAEKIFVFEEDGNIVQYTGNYSELKETISNSKECTKNKSENGDNSTKNLSEEISTSNNDRNRQRTLKFSFKEQKEYEEIDEVIASLEQRIEELEREMRKASSNFTKLQELVVEKEEIENQLEEKMERWVYLNDLAERIEEEKLEKRK